MIATAMLYRVIDQLGDRLDQSEEALLSHLRTQFAGVHFSVCRDDDIPERLTSAASSACCRLYYVESAGHCLQLTADAGAATGLVVALTDQDES